MVRLAGGASLVITALLSVAPVGTLAAPIDCTEATVVATHTSARHHAAHVVDGDDETFWAGDGHDLTELPTNLVIRFTTEQRVGRIEILTQVLKQKLRLKHVEVYVLTQGTWGQLAAVSDNTQTRLTLSVDPVNASDFRFRIRDTHRPDHAWPRINEIRLYGPDADAPTQAPPTEPAPNQTGTEALFLLTALGNLPELETTPYDPEKGYLWYVRNFLDTMLEDGLDRYGEEHSPMFVSIPSIPDHRHPEVLTPPIEGQRQHDRANFGGNLQHDIPLLAAARQVSRLTADPRYAAAADRYLEAFLTRCTDTATGLWPWGEHAHWDMFEEKTGHDTHEFLGRVPLAFWERAWSIDSEAVRRQGEGIMNHIVNLDTFDYNRHASLDTVLPADRQRKDGFPDFPRHGGFYIHLWAFLASKTGDETYVKRCILMMDNHLRVRHPKTGLLPSTTTRPHASHGSQTQLSLAVTMLEAAVLPGPLPRRNRPVVLRVGAVGKHLLLQPGQVARGASSGSGCSSPPGFSPVSRDVAPDEHRSLSKPKANRLTSHAPARRSPDRPPAERMRAEQTQSCHAARHP